MKKQILISLALFVFTTYQTVNAQNWNEIINVTASDAAAGDNFGWSVAIDGDYAVVGAYDNDNNGSPYFFERELPPIILDEVDLPDLIEQCEATPTAPTANSGTITATADIVFPITSQGTTIVTWTYDDGNGNTETQIQNIIINDTTAPNLSFANPSDVLIDSCTTEVIVPSPLISENCSTNTTLDFDGSNDRVIIPYSASLGFTTEFSVQAWIYPRANQYSRILSQYSASGNNSGEFVFDTYDGSNPTYLANGRGLRLVFTGIDGGTVMSSNVLNLNSWNHVAGTFNNGVLKLYVNGIEVNSGNTTFTSIPTSTINLAIGEDINVGAYEFFNGQIDELSIWNKALKPSEITIGYNKILEGTEPGLAAYYDFEEGTGSSVLIDKSSNGNDGILTNMDSNTDWVTSAAPITMASLTNDITSTFEASGTYPEGETTITWTATDANGNTSTLQQTINTGDTEEPEINFSNPSDASITTCDNNIAITTPLVSDNCSINTALSFDGFNDFVRVPSPYQNTGGATVEGWIKSTSLTSSLPLFGNIYISRFNNDGKVYAFFDTSTGNGDVAGNQSSTNVADGQWHHIAATNDGLVTKLYIDGQLEVSYVDNYVVNPNVVGIGGYQEGSYNMFNGKLDEARFWNRPLSQAEIQSSKNQILNGDEPGLVAYYNFENGIGSNILSDVTGNGYDGDLINMDSNTDWVSATVPLTNVAITNSFTGTSNASGTYPDGETTVVWTATDANGNTSTLQQTINAGDTEAPSITFSNPTDSSITSCDTNVTISSPLVSDNCAENTALDFDGVDEYVSISNFPFLTDLTLEAWIKPIYIANEGYRSIVSKGAVFDANTNFDFGIRRNWQNGNYTLYFYVQNGTTISGYALEINDTPNSWTHVAASFDNATKTVKLFQDGSLLGSSVLLISPTNGGQNLRIAHPASTDGQDEPFTGQIDEVRIWNRVLSETEISNSNYNILSGSEPGLVAYYDFEEGTGSSVLIDKSSNGNDGVLTNMDSNTDWVTSAAPITMASLTNDITGTSDASGTYPQGETIVTWTATDASGNVNSLEQTINAGDTVGPEINFSNPSDASITSCDNNLTITSPLVSDNCALNTALDFDGTNDYINLGIPLLSPSNGSQAHTVEMWVKATPKSAYTILFNQYGWNELYEYRSVFYIDTDANGGNLVFFKGSYVNIEGTTNLLDNQWHHVAMVREITGALSLYVDGVVEANGFDAYPYSNTNSLIGGQTLLSDNYYSGVMDEVRIWNTARTQTQITNSFNANISDAEPGLLAYYKFDDGAGNSLTNDESSNSYDGALVNMDINTVWVPSTSPVASVTLINDFNGTSDASGTYPEGETTITWTATDANGNQSTLEQIVNIACSITYTFNNDVWLPNNPSGAATPLDDIIVTAGNATINSNTSANTVTVEAGASLTLDAALTATDITLNSTSNSYSSLLIGVSGSVSGTINYNRFVNSNSLGNDLISSPLSGETWSNFLNPENATALLDNGGTPIIYAFAPFDKTTGDYENYDVNTTAILSSGKGYRVATDTGETLTFSGTVPTDVSVNIMNTATAYSKWNLVGNPYPSYINVHAFLNHEVDTGISNLDLLTNASAAIYGYNANTENKWTIYNLANTTVSTVLAPGQGFFVSADDTLESAYDLEFTTAIQTIGTSDDFIAGRNADLELIYLTIDLSSNTNTYSTDVYFNANASEGLDKGYDADLWGSTAPEFSIYSHLVQDNTGKPIALQTLNTTNLTDVFIPLGVHANQGEQISFSISETTLPVTVNVFLDDVLTNSSTLLNNSDYTITPSTDLSGTGRFFLRTSEEALSVADNNFDAINIFYEKRTKNVLINGRIQNNTVVEVYDMQGRKVLSSPLDAAVLENRIHVASLNASVYIVNLKNSSKQKTQKIIIN